jgi:lysophospholipase L1-like esterase
MKMLVRNWNLHLPPVGIAAACLCVSVLTGCASNPAGGRGTPSPTRSATRSETIAPTSTRTPSPTITATPTATRKWPLTVVFYGDSLLKIGEVGRQAKWSFSFVDNLREKLDPAYNLIVANYGGRGAGWAAKNIESTVLPLEPDMVTLWWGFNDLLGCGGFFNRATNMVIPANLDNLVARHIQGLRAIADRLLENGTGVLILTSIPVHGKLPWTHLDENYHLVWELDYWCEYNIGLERLASAQRTLVEEYAAEGKAVFLADIWVLFQEQGGTEGMYLDLMHPGTLGAEKIAEEWIRVFMETGAWLRWR